MIVGGSCADLGKSRIANRRKLARASLGVALSLCFAGPIAVESQAPRMYRIGFLGLSSPAEYAPSLEAFRQGLGDLGYEQGKHISIEYRWANGRYEQLPALAAQRSRGTSPSNSRRSSSW